MGCCQSFKDKRLDPDSFPGRIEWSLRAALSFFISSLCSYYFKDYIAVPFFLPVLILVASRNNFGETMHVIQSIYKGTTLISIIATITYFIPIIAEQYWYCTLFYFFMISLLLCVSLSRDHGARKIALAFHAVFTLQIAYNKDEDAIKVLDIWESWLMVPMTFVIASIGVIFPFPIFSYQQFLFAEDNAIRIIKEWLHDMMEYLYHSKDNKIASKIQWCKLQKFVSKGRECRRSLHSRHSVAASFEMLDAENLMIDSHRMNDVLSLLYILVGMHDAIQYLQYDDFHYDLLDAIKSPLRHFVDDVLDRLNDTITSRKKKKNRNKASSEQSPSAERPLMTSDKELMESFEAARHRLLFNEENANRQNAKVNVESVVGIYAFIYFLQCFAMKCTRYLDAYSLFMDQRKSTNCCNRWSVSVLKILYPLPWSTWTELIQSLSPLIHWKSPVFVQSFGISVAMTLTGLFFIYPPLHDHYPLGFWGSLTVAFVSDSHAGGTFYTSQMRLEGTFLGVTVGYILLRLVNGGMPELVGIVFLTLWVIPCGYLRSDPLRSYTGLVAAFTAPLIFLGYTEEDGFDIDYWGIGRIELTFIGIATLYVVLQVVSPNNARALLDEEVAESVRLMTAMFEDIFGQFQEMVIASTGMKSEGDEEDEKKEAEIVPNGVNEEELKRIPSSVNSLSVNGKREWKESPNELMERFQDRKSKVTALLNSERMLISASVFEPVFHRQKFDDELYHRMNDHQFWMLRRISLLDNIMQSLLVYIQRQSGSQWLLNQELVQDITPFEAYLKPFRKYKKSIIGAMNYFEEKLGGNDVDSEEESERKDVEFKNYEDVMKALEESIAEQWSEYEEFLMKYIEAKSASKSSLLTGKGALIRTVLTFGIKNLTLSVSEFAQCHIESSP